MSELFVKSLDLTRCDNSEKSLNNAVADMGSFTWLALLSLLRIRKDLSPRKGMLM